jgi:hypothetical protein
MAAGGLRPTLYTLVILVAGWSRLSGQAVLSGLVREDATGRLLSGVEVLVEGSDRSTITDKSGEYAFKSVPKGYQVVLFRSVGFRPVRIGLELGKGAVNRLDANLVPFAVRIDPLVVAAEVKQPHGMGREAFEERRRQGFGQFIDSLELRRSEDRRLSDLLRGHNGIVIAQNRFAMSARTGCYMQIIYDGQTAYSPATYAPPALTTPTPNSRSTRPSTRPTAPPTPLDINTFEVSGLEAVEMYRSLSDTPLQFGGAAAGCGTLVLWSRRGGLPPKP